MLFSPSQEGDAGGSVHALVVSSDAPTISGPYQLYVDQSWPEGLPSTSYPCLSLLNQTATLPVEWIADPGERLWGWVRLPELEPGLTIIVSPCQDLSTDSVWSGYSGVWHLDESSPTGSAVDSSPYGNDGTQVAVVQAKGKVGPHSKTFSGTGIVVADSTASGDWLVEEGGLDMGAGSLSISLWARYDDAGQLEPPENPSMVHKSTGPGGADDRGYNFFLTQNETLLFTPFGPQASTDGDKRVYFGGTATNALDGEWHHVALTFERLGSTDVAIVFLDGRPIGGPQETPGAHSSQVNSEPFRIGQGNRDARVWLGDLDEVRIGPGVWTTDRIHADYLSQSDPGSFLTWL